MAKCTSPRGLFENVNICACACVCVFAYTCIPCVVSQDLHETCAHETVTAKIRKKRKKNAKTAINGCYFRDVAFAVYINCFFFFYTWHHSYLIFSTRWKVNDTVNFLSFFNLIVF